MHLCIEHETAYRYDRPVRSVLQLLRLTPRDHDGQHVRAWRIEPSVEGRLKPQEDALGNIVHAFSSDATVEELRIRVTGEVETSDTQGIVRDAVERLPDIFFLRDTDLTRPDEAIRDFARDVAGDREPLAALHGILCALHEEVAYVPKPAQAPRAAVEAFANRRGAGRDLAQIFVAAARSLDIPARYVSGYLFREDAVEQDAGHAWAEAKVPGLGWIGFDAASGLCTTDAHIRLAIGLDALGAAPVRGSRTGGGSESMSVRLRVAGAQGGQEQRQAQSQG